MLCIPVVVMLGTTANLLTIGLSGFTLGQELTDKAPKKMFRKTALPGGESLREACSVDGKYLLSLSDDKWSKDVVAQITVKITDTNIVCNRNDVALPAWSFSLATDRGLKIGDSTRTVNLLYGDPGSTGSLGDIVLLRYPQGMLGTREILLIVGIYNGTVAKISMGFRPLG